ncbi:MAG: hypothetical protein Q7R50_01340 [Dehalococcoidales bacterium]|nr:hypothetical protein [Dehalococcoidales bacterium]
MFKQGWNKGKLDGFWINVGFQLETSEKPVAINFCTELGIRGKFYQYIDDKCGTDLHSGLMALSKLGFDHWGQNPQFVGRYVALSELTKGFELTKDDQIKTIISSVKTNINTLERSRLFKLLEKTFPAYKKQKEAIEPCYSV